MSETDAPCECKVGRAIETYGLDELNGAIRRRHDDGGSLRSLATFVNKRILRATIESDDVPSLLDSGLGVDALYEGLTDDEGRPEERARIRTRLEQAGIDVESVESDWVSHATIRSHLNNCLSVDTSREGSITDSDAVNTVEWARARSENVVAETVERLRNADRVSITDPSTSVSVRITCQECGRSYSLQSLLEDDGCACEPSQQ